MKTQDTALDNFSQNYKHGDWNHLTDNRPLSLSATRTSAVQQVNAALQETYSKNCLANVDEFYGVVVDVYERTVPTAEKKASQQQMTGNPNASATGPYGVYKVYIPELFCQPAPKHVGDPVLFSYPEVHDSDNLLYKPAIGSIVAVKYADPESLYGGLITSVDGAIDGSVMPALRSSISGAFANGTPQLIQGNPGTGKWTSALPDYGFTDWVHPVDPDKFRITSKTGTRDSPINRNTRSVHSGIDFGGPHGSPIYAVTAGTITYRREAISSAAGWNIEIYHGTWTNSDTSKEYGIYTRYLHLRNKGSTDHATDQNATPKKNADKTLTPGPLTPVHDYAVTLGQQVPKGTVIGYVGSTGGSTGPHLHYELILSDLKGQKGRSVYGSTKTYVAGLFDHPPKAASGTGQYA